MINNYLDTKNSKEYKNYFELLEQLGDYFFNLDSIDSSIYLTIDEDELSKILGLNKEKAIQHLVQSCQLVLFSNSQLYKNIVEIEKKWRTAGCPGYPPQLCFVVLFVIAATRMGSKTEIADFRDYYKQLYILLNNTEKGYSQRFGEQFVDAFVTKYLFKNLSDWISEICGSDKNTFHPSKPGAIRIHQSWILNQALLNRKDLNLLNSFFKYLNYQPNDEISSSFMFAKLKDFLITENNSSSIIKARSFSVGFRKSIANNDFSERIEETLVNKFSNWDGNEVDSEGEQVIDFIHRVSFDEENLTILEIKGLLKIQDFGFLNSDQIKLKEKNNLSEINVNHNQLLNVYQTEELNEIFFEKCSWEIVGLSNEKKLVVNTSSKKIMVFKYIYSDVFVNESWEEIKKTENIDDRETYTIICLEDIYEKVHEYLSENSNFTFMQEPKKYKVNNSNKSVYVFKEINFYPERNNNNYDNELSIFFGRQENMIRLRLIDGLEIERYVYLSNELPSLVIPENYIQNSEVSINVNNRELKIEFFEPPYVLTPSLYQEYLQESNVVNFDYNYRNQYLDKVKFLIKDHWDEVNTPNIKTLGYELENKSSGKFNFKNLIPKEIMSSSDTAYLSGGQLNLLFNINEDDIIILNYHSSDSEIILIGRNTNILNHQTRESNEIDWIKQLDKATTIFFFNTSSGDIENSVIEKQLTFKPFTYIEKILKNKNFTWQIVFGEKDKLLQIGKKLPKGFESSLVEDFLNEEVWARTLLRINEEMLEDVDKNLWKKYVEKANDILSKKNE